MVVPTRAAHDAPGVSDENYSAIPREVRLIDKKHSTSGRNADVTMTAFFEHACRQSGQLDSFPLFPR